MTPFKTETGIIANLLLDPDVNKVQIKARSDAEFEADRMSYLVWMSLTREH